MGTALSIMRESANSVTARSGGKTRNYLRTNYLVMQKARSLFPYKTAMHIAEITGYPLRTVEYWLSKDRLPGEAIGALIQSDHGFAFVEALAERTSWWRKIRKALAQTDHRTKIAQEAQHAATELAAALTRASSALGLRPEELDSDQDRPVARALRAPAGKARR
jgi:hypothetical protein